MDKKFVYRFGGGLKEGDGSMVDILGGKGANLAEMCSIGLPVPAGFVISAEACHFFQSEESDGHERMGWPDGLMADILEGIRHIEEVTGKKFGSNENPLLVSVRSGAAVSMPGMMETILNLGLNDQTVDGLISQYEDESFAYDCYRRLIEMFGTVVHNIPITLFRNEAVAGLDAIHRYKQIIQEQTGNPFPEDPQEQLELSIQAVFQSWSSPRAVTYRSINGIHGLKGTAVTVQAMVFGNYGDQSATGVCFTRNPSSGEKELFGEFLLNAQGEDVVDGSKTPIDIVHLKEIMPFQYGEIRNVADRLERHYGDMQDIEFTIERGQLYILQTRSGKRNGAAAVKIAVDMVQEGIITQETAIRDRVDYRDIETLLHTHLDDEECKDYLLCRGLPASPGAVTGKVVFSPEDVLQSDGSVILVREETSSDDVIGMASACGFVTVRGGRTSHAAVVARGWGKPCVTGCQEIEIDVKLKQFKVGDRIVRQGDFISIDGGKGLVVSGRRRVIKSSENESLLKFLEWLDEVSRIKVRVNADSAEDVRIGRRFGAAGIGLCRTEHMFFEPARLLELRKLILLDPKKNLDGAQKLKEIQKSDFIRIFMEMEGCPVTIRLLDPPLHEFFPSNERDIVQMAEELSMPEEEIHHRILSLKETNPMLGNRGCRLGILRPEITRIQTQAIVEAAIELKMQGIRTFPEIMVPLVGMSGELLHQKRIIESSCQEVFDRYGETVGIRIGAMLEVPRATVTADRIAEHSDFFSFGTNDLTQMVLGFSRDDTNGIIQHYLQKGILKDDPFNTLDTEGVGRLVEIAITDIRNRHPHIKIGVCGEHGGEPESIRFFHRQGVDYISCSPYRVPVAKLAVAKYELSPPEFVYGSV